MKSVGPVHNPESTCVNSLCKVDKQKRIVRIVEPVTRANTSTKQRPSPAVQILENIT